MEAIQCEKKNNVFDVNEQQQTEDFDSNEDRELESGNQ